MCFSWRKRLACLSFVLFCDGDWDEENQPAPVEGGWKGLWEVLNSSLDLLKQFAHSGQACEDNVWRQTEWCLLFS